MFRYKATIEYDGTAFVGWQKQQNGLSVQQVLENSIQKLGYQDIKIYGSGRTDAGVHALGQVAHFDLADDCSYKLHRLRESINHFIQPHSIKLLDLQIVNHDFHARFDAVKRSYIYKIIYRSTEPIFWRNRAWHIRNDLEIGRMQEASQLLVGYHDFASFRSSHCQAKNSYRTLDSIEITQQQDQYAKLIEIKLTARSFLHNQVRIIVGSLHEIGRGNWDIDRISKALLSKNRSLTGLTAPPFGLYLNSIDYN